MDQYFSGDGDLLLGVPLPLLPLPLMPRPAVVDLDSVASVDSPAGVPAAPSPVGMPDLSREGPFDVRQDSIDSGATVYRGARIA